MKPQVLCSPLVGLLASLSLVAASAGTPYGYMPYDTALAQRWQAERATRPVYQAAPGYPRVQGAVNLLSHFNFDPVKRDQGHTGTCWNWGCQAVLSIDYAIQHPEAPLLTNGLSVQFLNSYVYLVDFLMMGGGTPSEFAEFYNGMRFAIPWDNVNAQWTDGGGTPKTPPATIHTQPNLPLQSIRVVTVLTFTNDPAVAIANLKSALDAGHPLWFNMTLANEEDWDAFCTYWDKTNATEETVIDLAQWAGHKFADTGGSHVVACVGYDDRDPDPAKHCWLMLNSWGNGSHVSDEPKRPNGIFRLAMHTRYDATLETFDPNNPAPIYEWGLLETVWTDKVRKDLRGMALNLAYGDPAACSLRITNASFPKTAALTKVGVAAVGLNWEYLSCTPDRGNWTVVSNGFHFEPMADAVPRLQMDIDTNTCTWSLTASRLPADWLRTIYPQQGLRIDATCRAALESSEKVSLGIWLMAFDELNPSASGTYTSLPPDAPGLTLQANGTQTILRIRGETGRTCEVLEADTLGGDWLPRMVVPMTQPVEEVTLPLTSDPNRFWRVRVH